MFPTQGLNLGHLHCRQTLYHLSQQGRQSIKKQIHHLADRGPVSQSYGFSSSHVQIRELDRKTSLSTEELMLLNCGSGKDFCDTPGTERRSNQSILKEINPEYSLKGLMLKLRFFGHLMQRAYSLKRKRPWCWKRLKARREGGSREWEG